MYYGMKSEQKIFFNYGLTFILIETYTVFCTRLFSIMPVGIASLILGLLLFMTAKLLKNIYIKKDKTFVLELHIDKDDASEFNLENGDVVILE